MSHKPLSLQLLATGALVGALGCGTDPDEFGRCDPPLSVAVQTAATLEFAWTPDDCDLYTLTVMQGREVQWHLFMVEDRNGLLPPIRYGEVPAGARASDTAPLFPGPYTLELTRLDENGLQTLVASQGFLAE
jgi:hypothetical protein